MNNNNSILIILINYFNDSETINFASNLLLNQSTDHFSFIICNNGTKNRDELNAFQNQNQLRVKVFHADKNLGYLGGANEALKFYLENNTLPDFVIICNTDMQITDNLFLEKLIQLHTTSVYQLIAPDVKIASTLVSQNPYYKNRLSNKKLQLLLFVTSNFYLYKFYYLFYQLKRLAAKNNKSTEPVNSIIYAMHGSFMIFKKEFFESGGTFDFPSFLFGEEIFIAEQALKLDFVTYFETELKVLHYEHATTGLSKKPLLLNYLQQSLVMLKNNYFNE